MLYIELAVIALKEDLYYLMSPHRELIFDTLPADLCMGGSVTIHRAQAMLDKTAKIDLCRDLPEPAPCFRGLTTLFGQQSSLAVATPVIRAGHCKQEDLMIVAIPAMERKNEFVEAVTDAYLATRTTFGDSEATMPLRTVPRVMKFPGA